MLAQPYSDSTRCLSKSGCKALGAAASQCTPAGCHAKSTAQAVSQTPTPAARTGMSQCPWLYVIRPLPLLDPLMKVFCVPAHEQQDVSLHAYDRSFLTSSVPGTMLQRS